MERRETAMVCGLLSAAFPNYTMSAETVEMWHAMLSDIPGGVVLRAAQDWILTEERYPTIAGIRRLCADVAGCISASPNDAWAEVTDAITTRGVYGGMPEWSNEFISKTVKTLGWSHLCHTENIATVRAQFLKMYADFKATAEKKVISHRGFDTSQEIVALPNTTGVEYKPLTLTEGD